MGRIEYVAILSPKHEYSSTAIMQVNERYQLDKYGDKETRQRMTLPQSRIERVPLVDILDISNEYMGHLEDRTETKSFLCPLRCMIRPYSDLLIP